MRVYDLARTLNVTSKALLPELKKLRVPASTASSSVDDKDVQRVMAHYQAQPQDSSGQAEGAPAAPRGPSPEDDRKQRMSSALDEARKRIEMLRAQKQGGPVEKPADDVSEQAARERARRQAARDDRVQRLRAAQGRVPPKPARPPAPAGAAPPAPGRAAPPATGDGADKKPRKMRKKDRREAEAQAPPGSKLVVPEIGVMKLDKKDFRGRRRPDAVKKKKGRIKPTKILTARDVRGGARARGPVGGRGRPVGRKGPRSYQPREAKPIQPKQVTIYGDITIGEFAEKCLVPVGDLMKTLLLMGETFTINDLLPQEFMDLLAEEYEFKLEVVPDTDEHDIAEYVLQDNPENLKPRPPIVTIMGHVDHGKTTLLDAYRDSDVAAGEAGGITQTIGAYYVQMNKGTVVFLDTPGHEAFTAMRARGAQITDVVVLVVAANDGVMPQTLEALNHAKAAEVPIIVAINKIDLPDANPMRVKQELMAHQIVPEEFGGDTIFAEISAKERLGIDKLFDMILLQAEVLELQADPERGAEGIIIESHVDSSRGALATVLITTGTLKAGDMFVAGDISGRVRRMRDEHNRMLEQAGPSRPVELLGLSGAPEAGEHFLVMEDERAAREIADKRNLRRRIKHLHERQHVTLENLLEYIEGGKIKELNLIVKGDLQGSIEAIRQSLTKLPSDKVKVRILHSAVGPINESDVNLAITTGSIVIGFNIRPEPAAAALARGNGIDVRLYRVIYDLLEDIEKALVGMLEPTYKELFRGRADVLQTFRISKVGSVAGCFVSEGEMLRGAQGRLVRDSVVVHDGKIGSLRRVKDDVSRVQVGLECGIQFENYQDVKDGDVIECYELESVTQGL